jgi:hypothetical protein
MRAGFCNAVDRTAAISARSQSAAAVTTGLIGRSATVNMR